MRIFRNYKGYTMLPSAQPLDNGLYAANLELESQRGAQPHIDRFEALDYFFEAEQATAYALRWGELWIDTQHADRSCIVQIAQAHHAPIWSIAVTRIHEASQRRINAYNPATQFGASEQSVPLGARVGKPTTVSEMDRLQAMQVFTRVVESNSFSRAADTLDMPRASVTTTIQNLEAFLGVRLLQRTTRRLNLTPDGTAYYERCVRILADIAETEQSFHEGARNPRGKLRVDMPGSIGRLVVLPRLCEFHSRYPDVELMVGLSDKPVDLIQEGVDAVIRVGTLQDSTLVARRVGVFQGVTCASPEYLERHGEPRTLQELESHCAVNYFSSRTGRIIDWDFLVDGKPVTVKMKGAVAVNDADAYLSCALEGFGLIQPARFMALPYLQSGQLKEVLPQWKTQPMPISVVYPHNRHLSPKVRVFVDWVAEMFEHCPLLSDQKDAEKRCAPTVAAAGAKAVRRAEIGESEGELVL
ncbi:LysR substrate binding transcriptional regulator [Apophysomyces sp. BC1015]|nr:LysR substrate binding transcriptional regulator [Apophysomyces sp. BC1015]